jgi:hypothetical protein
MYAGIAVGVIVLSLAAYYQLVFKPANPLQSGKRAKFLGLI